MRKSNEREVWRRMLDNRGNGTEGGEVREGQGH